MRSGEGPSSSLTRASTSSAMVRTWRRLVPLVITKASVMASTSPTSSTIVSSPFLSAAALAAVVTQCRMSSIARSSSALPPVEPRALEILAHHDRDVDHVEGLVAEHQPARSERLLHLLGGGLLGLVVEDD